MIITKRAEIELASGSELDLIGARFKVWRFRDASPGGTWMETDHSFRGRVLNAFERAGLIL